MLFQYKTVLFACKNCSLFQNGMGRVPRVIFPHHALMSIVCINFDFELVRMCCNSELGCLFTAKLHYEFAGIQMQKLHFFCIFPFLRKSDPQYLRAGIVSLLEVVISQVLNWFK